MTLPTRFALVLTVALSQLGAAAAEDAKSKAQKLIDNGLTFLKSQQKPDGSWQDEKQPPAMTAIVLKAFVQEGGLSTWDIAAAGLIAERAGAQVTAMDGGPWFDLGHGTRSIGLIAAPPAHHGTLLELVR